MAQRLVDAGWQVLLLERGDWVGAARSTDPPPRWN
jgi:phytoene dehydrogenase-like protein